MNLESQKVTVAKSAEYIFNALTDVKNFEKLMPESIARFEVTGDDSFIFALKGMPEIKLKQKDQTPHSKVVLGAASDKLPFTLTGNITEVDANNSEIQLQFEGSFNPMMAMMVKGPIGKFIEALAGNMNKL
ncbi:SRPBCC family protein [Myroides odoratimimus]|uniref:SRPBCC family protein n=1 Tax=Myroides odoratimimus TaxID=76832 RepID=UPI002576EFB4|nr:SRPBCC family protein [Myroides odoratimimus]MDM1415511.1 SRPBCC family protein [Myroides odoratimimus]MDM1447851.1 SRPBCC family protein [Myroides odoratimimus]MEC4008922.1 SRPBCC family protein [Myroides odoratimimus]